MKNFITIIALIFSMSSYGEIIFYDINFSMESAAFHQTGTGLGGNLNTTISIDTDSGNLKSFQADFTRFFSSSTEFSLDWSGTHSLVWDLNEFGVGAHELRLNDLLFSSGAYIDSLMIEFNSPAPENPYYHLNRQGDAPWGSFYTATGEELWFSGGGVSEFYKVPEPATIILFSLGLLGISVKRRINNLDR